MEVVSAADLLSEDERAVLRGEVPLTPRRAAPPAESRKKAPLPKNTDGITRVFVDIGTRDRVEKDDIFDTLENHDFPSEDVEFIALRETHSFVGVPDDLLEDLLYALDGREIAGQKVKAEKARPRRN